MHRRLIPVVLAAAILLAVLGSGNAYCSVAVSAGAAWTRGFYSHAGIAYADIPTLQGGLPEYLSPRARLGGHFSYRDAVGLLACSGSVLLQLKPPTPIAPSIGLYPYVAAGPSLTYAYSWADLEDFGNVSKSEFSTTFSVFVGTEVFSTGTVSIFTEARYTIPSDFTFDYVMLGFRVRSPGPSGID
ncbi:MAG: hypothetical protein V2A71_06100 [Candidatus Eisenbacteria bacterium]